jgi:hypothetical protein
MPEDMAAMYRSGTFLTSLTTADATCEDAMVGLLLSSPSEVKVLGKIMTGLKS